MYFINHKLILCFVVLNYCYGIHSNSIKNDDDSSFSSSNQKRSPCSSNWQEDDCKRELELLRRPSFSKQDSVACSSNWQQEGCSSFKKEVPNSEYSKKSDEVQCSSNWQQDGCYKKDESATTISTFCSRNFQSAGCRRAIHDTMKNDMNKLKSGFKREYALFFKNFLRHKLI